MIQFLLSLDYISPKLYLRINSKSRFENLIGGVLTITTFLTIAAISLYLTAQTFQRENFTTIYNQEASSRPNYTVSDYPIIVGLSNEKIKYFDNPESLYTIQAFYMEVINATNPTYTPVPVARCSSFSFGKYTSYLKDLPLDSLFCLNTSSVNSDLYGIYGTNSFSYLGILFNRCINNTEIGKMNCKPATVIEISLNYMAAAIIMMDYNIDHRDFINPGQLFMNSMPFQLSTTIFKRLYLEITNIEYISDVGIIFQDNKVQEYFNLKLNGESVDNRKSGAFAEGNFCNLSIGMNKFKAIYLRKFTKIPDLLAYIGGIIKGLLTIIIPFENYLVKKLIVTTLAKEIFFIENEENLTSSRGRIQSKQPKTKTNQNPSKNNMIENNNNYINKIQTFNANANSFQVKDAPILEKKGKKINETFFKPNFLELVLPFGCYKTKKNWYLNQVEKYLRKKTSIETIVKQLNHIKKIRAVLFSEDEANVFKLIKKPSLSSLNDFPEENVNQRANEESIGAENTSIDNLLGNNQKSPIQERLLKLILKTK